VAFPTFVGHGGAVQESTTTLTVVNNASAATGDYEVLVIETMDEAVTLTTTGGFTAVPFNDGSGNGIWPVASGTATIATRLTVFERIYSGQADPVTNDPGNHVIANIFTFRKSSGTWSTLDDVRSPTEDTGWKATTEATEDTSLAVAGITTDTVDQLICGFIVCAKPDVAGGTAELDVITNANLANITERHDDAAASGNGGWIGAWTGEEATSAQAIGNTDLTLSTASFKAALIIAIRDAPPSSGISYTFASETDAAQGLSKQIGIPLASETDASQGLAKRLGIAFSSETDAAQGLAARLGIAFASEVDTAGGLGKTLGFTFASETDLAGSIALAIVIAYTAALETDAAQGLSKNIGIAPATETDTSQGLSLRLALAPATELDEAIGLAKKLSIAIAEELDTAHAITLGGGGAEVPFTVALETDEAGSFSIKIGIGPATETDEAREVKSHYGGGGKEGYVVWRETRNPNKTKRRLPFIGGRYIR
jgi:hypothetical protein